MSKIKYIYPLSAIILLALLRQTEYSLRVQYVLSVVISTGGYVLVVFFTNMMRVVSDSHLNRNEVISKIEMFHEKVYFNV